MGAIMDTPCGVRVLKFDGAVAPRVLKFDSGYAAEGCGIAPWAMSIKSALRDLLSVSCDMINILVISRCAAPPFRLRRTSPYAGGRIKHLEASLHKRLYSKHGLLCPLEEAEKWWR